MDAALKHLSILFAVFVLCLGGLSPAWGRDEVRVAFNELAPWKMQESDGTFGGIDTDFLRLVAERMDLDLKIEKMPFIRAMRMLKAGGADIMTGVLRRPDREKFLTYVDPPYRRFSNKAFYVKKDGGPLISKYEDLYGLTIGVGRGVRYFPAFDHDPRIRKDAVSDSMLNFNKLLHDRFDAFIHTEESCDYHLRNLHLEDKIKKAPFVYRQPQPVYIVVSKLSPLAARLDELSRVVRELLDEGRYERLRSEYLSR